MKRCNTMEQKINAFLAKRDKIFTSFKTNRQDNVIDVVDVAFRWVGIIDFKSELSEESKSDIIVLKDSEHQLGHAGLLGQCQLCFHQKPAQSTLLDIGT